MVFGSLYNFTQSQVSLAEQAGRLVIVVTVSEYLHSCKLFSNFMCTAFVLSQHKQSQGILPALLTEAAYAIFQQLLF